MSSQHTIKKYPNRRLYDTSSSRYVTLEDIRELITNGEDFVVKDARTEEDLTRGILLQIIAKQEHDGEPLFSTEALANLASFYGKSVQSTAAKFIESSIALFGVQQQEMEKQLKGAMGSNPFETFSRISEENWTAWQEMQKEFLQAASGTGTRQKSDEQDEEPSELP